MNLQRLTWILIGLLIATLAIRMLIYIISGSDAYLYFLTDDFYYYLLPAKNLVAHGISSFDGLTITNGYHPLWFMSICVMTLISGGHDIVIFILVTCVSVVSSLYTVRTLLRLQCRLFPDAWLAPAALVLTAMMLTAQSFIGMETVLTIPLFCALILRITQLELSREIRRTDALWLGFLCSMLILSRLETALVVGMFLLGFALMSKSTPKQKIFFYTRFALGGLLVPMYFAFNLMHFGYLMPVSAMVKGLRVGHAIRSEVIAFLLLNRDALAGMAFVPIGLVLLWLSRKRITSVSNRLALVVVIVYPLILYTTFFLSSDWCLQRWYLWPLPICTFVVLAMLSERFRFRSNQKINEILQTAAFSISMVVVLFAIGTTITRDILHFEPDSLSPYVRGKEMSAFVQAHPGRYAMGDAAGTVAYLINAPVLQLEGLAADYTYYEHIKNGDDLLSVLQSYKIDYLISFSVGVKRQANGCYEINEPLIAQAGPHSHTMFGTLCEEPLLTIRDPSGSAKELIFAIGKP